MLKKVSKKLDVTRSRVSRHWQHYRTEKAEILSKKRIAPEFKKGLIDELRGKTRSNISTFWEDYRGFKYGALHVSDISDFTVTKKSLTENTIQKYYKARKGYDESKLDKQIPKLLEKSNVLGVGLIFKIMDEETGRIMHVSDFITKGLYDRIKAKDETLYDHLSDKLSFTGYVEYTLISIHIRIIYAKTKNG
jgi:hypothetical protein